MVYQLSFYCQWWKRYKQKWDFFENLVYNFQKKKIWGKITIFFYRTLIPLTRYAKYHFATNKTEVVSIECIFTKIWCKTFENYLLKISIQFLVENAMPFHLIHKLIYYQEYFSLIVKKIRIFSLKNLKTKYLQIVYYYVENDKCLHLHCQQSFYCH